MSIDGHDVGNIRCGLVVLLGIHRDDAENEAVRLAGKIVHLRIFDDENGIMNRSIADIGGEMLIVSQFTLFGDCRKGRRPGYAEAAPPERAEPLFLRFVDAVRNHGIPTATGRFRTDMEVSLVNDGPVTLLLDTSGNF